MSIVTRLLLLELFLLASCRPESFDIDYSIILDSYEMSIYEPSGLSYSSDKESLYTVSDRGMVYEISLTGNTLRELPFTGDDLEAIFVDPLTSDIYICEEGKGKLVRLNGNGILQGDYDILNNPGNSGLEGLTYNNNLDEFYMLKEKSEGLL
ncbi:MAG: SdiA-regulated domain-containing protein, partial [Bacteroidota bacterium]